MKLTFVKEIFCYLHTRDNFYKSYLKRKNFIQISNNPIEGKEMSRSEH